MSRFYGYYLYELRPTRQGKQTTEKLASDKTISTIKELRK